MSSGSNPIDKAAQGMEAYFIRRFLSEVNFGGSGEGRFQDMLVDALSESMTQAGGIGLKEQIARSLREDPEMGPDMLPSQLSGLGVPSRAGLLAYKKAVVSRVPPIREGRVSSRFGLRIHPIDGVERMHRGVDLAAPEGTSVQAVEAGTVVRSAVVSGYGQLVVLRHPDGVETRYGHLSERNVKEGDHVDKGTHIGAVGQSGHSTGPHLHFELRRNGIAMDPMREIPRLNEWVNRPIRVDGGE